MVANLGPCDSPRRPARLPAWMYFILVPASLLVLYNFLAASSLLSVSPLFRPLDDSFPTRLRLRQRTSEKDLETDKTRDVTDLSSELNKVDGKQVITVVADEKEGDKNPEEANDSGGTEIVTADETSATAKKESTTVVDVAVTDPKVENKEPAFKKSQYDVCVVGAGLSGAVIAERYANVLDSSILVMEKRDHIGGNCFDYIDEETGIRVSRYGAHLFHTKYDRVWEYVQQFSDWTPYEHKVIGLVNGTHVPIPVNIDTVNKLFNLSIKDEKEMNEWLEKEQVHYDRDPADSEEMALSRVGKRLYELIFHPYTKKQWDKEPKELGPEVTARIPVRNNYDGRYFDDPHQALPSNGYTAIFEKLLGHKNIEVHLQTDYFKVRDGVKCGRTYFTGPIDAYFAHLGWDKLEYRSIDFERKVVKDVDFFQPASVVNHPSGDVDFTRIVEYKHLPIQPGKSKDTILFYERSRDDGDPYYPVPNPENKALYAKYQEMASKEKGVTFVGRLANYKYFNMDQSILNALELFDKDTGTGPKDDASSKVDISNPVSKKPSFSKPSYDICVVGAGLSGAVIAERYANVLNSSILVMEKREHIGGNCYDYIDKESGIRVSRYGAHLFHTKYDRVWEYVQQLSDWTPYEHKVIGAIAGKHVPIPVNIDTVNVLFNLTIKDEKEMDEWLEKEQVHYDRDPADSEEMALSRVGKRLYELIFHPYTKKQWDKEPKELGPEVTARIPVRNNHDGRYFDDPHQALPSNGYTAIFEKLLGHKNIEVHLQTDYFKVRDGVKCGRTYFTGPIDAYFAHLGWDKLEYRSIDFERKVIKDVDFFQPASVVNHPSGDVDFTRIVEYKHLPIQPGKSKDTILFYERSRDDGDPYYPVPNPENKALYAKYQEMASKEKGVTFVGRLANYKYFNMDQSILNALELFDKDTQSSSVKIAT